MRIAPMDGRTLYDSRVAAANAAGLAMPIFPDRRFRIEHTGAAWIVEVWDAEKRLGYLFDGEYVRY